MSFLTRRDTKSENCFALLSLLDVKNKLLLFNFTLGHSLGIRVFMRNPMDGLNEKSWGSKFQLHRVFL